MYCNPEDAVLPIWNAAIFSGYMNEIGADCIFDSPDMDIPGKDELSSCSCSPREDKVCSDRPFYYTIIVQNWGDLPANYLEVKNSIDSNRSLKYVPGSTEVFSRVGGVIRTWRAVEDVDGKSELEYGIEISEIMETCDRESREACDTYIFRFQVEPPDGFWDEDDYIENFATIKADHLSYRTNSAIPLTLSIDTTCPLDSECSDYIENCGAPLVE